VTRRPLLVGEGPSRTGDRWWRFPLSGSPARVLCSCAGWEPQGPASEPGSWTWALYERFETVNVFTRWRESSPWSVVAARERAEGIWQYAVRERVPAVVLLGRRTAAAFEVGSDYYAWRGQEPEEIALGGPALPRLVVLPHPSGRNLLLNEPATRERIGRVLREAVSVCGPAD
jgi:hypothetical protein